MYFCQVLEVEHCACFQQARILHQDNHSVLNRPWKKLLSTSPPRELKVKYRTSFRSSKKTNGMLPAWSALDSKLFHSHLFKGQFYMAKIARTVSTKKIESWLKYLWPSLFFTKWIRTDIMTRYSNFDFTLVIWSQNRFKV